MTDEELEKLKDLAFAKLFSPYTDSVILNAESGETEDSSWYLQSREPLLTDNSVFRFCRNATKVLAIPAHYELYGKYVSLKAVTLKQTRIYNLCFTFTPLIYPRLMEMIFEFKKKRSSFSKISNIYKPYLELIIKKKGNFSKYLHEMNLNPDPITGNNNKFTITGPFVINI